MSLNQINSILAQKYGATAVMKAEMRCCEEHGPYTAQSLFANVWTGCPVCRQRQQEAETAAYAAQLRREIKRAQMAAAVGRAGIAARFSGCTVENFIADPAKPAMVRAKAVARDYAENFAEVLQSGRCLIFSGNRGTGKNHLACGIANKLLENGYSAVVVTVADMMQTIKDSYGGGSEMKAVSAFAAPDLLVLDEFGMGGQTETEARLLFTVINRRYEALKPTLVLTNLTAEDFSAKVDARIRDRLRDGGGKLIAFNWESYRG